MKERWAVIKPYLIGAVIGAVAVPVIGIWRGDIVTAGTHTRGVQAASVETRATICEALARVHHEEVGGGELTGFQNRQAREDLAARFAVMPGESAAQAAVRQACATRLGRAVAA